MKTATFPVICAFLLLICSALVIPNAAAAKDSCRNIRGGSTSDVLGEEFPELTSWMLAISLGSSLPGFIVWFDAEVLGEEFPERSSRFNTDALGEEFPEHSGGIKADALGEEFPE